MILKGLRFFPILSCKKKILPLDENKTRIESIKNTGESRIIPNKENAISNSRFTLNLPETEYKPSYDKTHAISKMQSKKNQRENKNQPKTFFKS